MKLVRALPNILTGLRLAGALSLLLVEPLGTAFYVIYTACGLSDVLDGAIARAARCTSALGAKLDSIADLTFYSILAIRIFKVLWKALPIWEWIWIGCVLLLRLSAYLVAARKYHRFAAMHTWMNKATGLLVFGIPYVVMEGFFPWYGLVGCIVSTLASGEELVIHCISREYKPGRKTILLPAPEEAKY